MMTGRSPLAGVAAPIHGLIALKHGALWGLAWFPAILGLMLGLAGVCYLVNTLALLLAPELADTLFPWIMLPVLVGELSLSLWMIVKGANFNGQLS